SIERSRRDAYVAGAASPTRPDTTLFVFAFGPRGVPPVGLTGSGLARRLGPWVRPVGRIAGEEPPGAARVGRRADTGPRGRGLRVWLTKPLGWFTFVFGEYLVAIAVLRAVLPAHVSLALGALVLVGVVGGLFALNMWIRRRLLPGDPDA